MKNVTTNLVTGLFALLAVSAWGAQAPLGEDALKKAAASVVVGTVVDVTSVVEKAKVDKGPFNRDRVFTIELKVSSVSKGSLVKAGEDITIVVWQAHRRLPGHAGPQGHGSIPKKGDKVTVYLKDKKGDAYRVVLPNGISIEKKTN